MDINLRWEQRLCKVDDEIGYFHMWEQFFDIVGPGPSRGGHSGGNIGRVYGIVEFADRVGRVDPSDIQFIDEQNDVLNDINKQIVEKKMEKKCKNCVHYSDHTGWSGEGSCRWHECNVGPNRNGCSWFCLDVEKKEIEE